MAAKAALLFGKALLFFTFWTAAVHLSAFQIIFEKKAAARAFSGTGLDRCLATGQRAFDDCFTAVAPVLTFEGFSTRWTFFDSHR